MYKRFIFMFCFIYTVFSTTSNLNMYSCTLSKATLISPDRNRFSDFSRRAPLAHDIKGNLGAECNHYV
jgi:hypothetical protein